MKSQVAYFNDLFSAGSKSTRTGSLKPANPFWVMVRKEVADQVHSWRFIILAGLVLLTFVGSMYVSLSNISKAVADARDPDRLFL